jgi:hydrogenase maturation factor
MSKPPDGPATAAVAAEPRPTGTAAPEGIAARSKYQSIRLSHGSGGKLTLELIEELFVAVFSNEPLRELTDAAIVANLGGRIAFATDSHTVKPAFFPGGDIGRLAVAGTINDLAVMGAKPAYMTAAFLLEEGYDMAELERVVRSMKATADEAGVAIVAGDTKVLERGHGDGIFINTTGIGFLADDVRLGVEHVRPGDQVLVNGTLGDHGIAVMSRREGLDLAVELESDVAPLNGLIEAVRGKWRPTSASCATSPAAAWRRWPTRSCCAAPSACACSTWRCRSTRSWSSTARCSASTRCWPRTRARS